MKEIFDINRLNLEEIEKIISEPDIPHNHDYEELIIGMEGDMDHFIDFKSQTFSSPYISFVTKGKMHRVFPLVVEGKCSIWVIRFKSEFIPEITFRLYSYYHDHASIQMQDCECFDRMVMLCEMMFSEKNIETRKLIEAKNLLISTDKTISEVGYDLGFNEKAYFSSVFKKKTGQTPSEFREEMNRLIS